MEKINKEWIKKAKQTALFRHYMRQGFTEVKALRMLKRIVESAATRSMQTTEGTVMG